MAIFLIAAIITGLTYFVNYWPKGTTGVYPYYDVPNSSINNRGYYIPHGITALWKIHYQPAASPPPNGVIIDNERTGLDLSLYNVNSKGWPINYVYKSYNCCGPSLNTILPIAMIFNFVIYFALLELIVYSGKMFFQKHKIRAKS